MQDLLSQLLLDWAGKSTLLSSSHYSGRGYRINCAHLDKAIVFPLASSVTWASHTWVVGG